MPTADAPNPSEPVRLRVATPADAPALLAVYAPYVRETFITFEYDAPDAAEFAGRVARTLERFPYLAACAGERVLGYAYAGTFHNRPAYDWAVETSIYVDRAARGRHVGSLLHEGLEHACRLMGVRNLEACIAWPDQGGSVGFHERMGYRMVGRFEACGYKLGAWRDMVWMEKHIAGHEGAPEPLRAFPRIRDEVEELLKGLA